MYDLKFIQKDSCKDGSDHLFTFIYKFYSPHTKLHYIIRAELHTGDVFAIKFYCKKDKRSDYKYNKIVNRGYALRILQTCLSLVIEILKDYPYANFAIYSSRSIDFSNPKKLTENLEENQRYRIYKEYIKNRVGDETFTHLDYPAISSYILINNCNKDIEQKEREILEMFDRTYHGVPDIV